MNLHWGRTLENERLMVRIRPRNRPNYSIPFAYNYTQDKQFWDSILERSANRSVSNHSALSAKNDFLKKGRTLTNMKAQVIRSHSFTTVVIISSIFLFFTMTITAAVIVFCRKKNTVFALQKCEQEDEDNEYEMDELELNTDVEYTSEYESETDQQSRPRTSRRTSRQAEIDPLDSPLHQPLMPAPAPAPAVASTSTQCDSEYLQHLLPPGGDKRYHPAGSPGDSRGAYQRMVVTAVLENQHLQDEPQPNEKRSKLMDKLQKKYKDFAHMTHSDIDDDFSAFPMQSAKLPVISITYADDPPSYDSLSYHVPDETDPSYVYPSKKSQDKTDPSFQNIPYVELKELPVKDQCNACKSCSMYVTMPDDKGSVEEHQHADTHDEDTVLFVDLPPKPVYRMQMKNTQSRDCEDRSIDALYQRQSMSLPATPLQDTAPVVGGGGGSYIGESCGSLSAALEAGPCSIAASWADISDPRRAQQTSVSRNSSRVHLTHSSSDVNLERSRQLDLRELECALTRSRDIGGTRESGIDLVLCSPTASTPLSPPPGFRNEDYFITPSSTDDSGVMMVTSSTASNQSDYS